MEAQAKAIMDLTAAISGMNDMMQTKFNDVNAKLDEIQPLARNLQRWRPQMEQAVEDLRSEINDRRAHFYDAVGHGAPDAEADSPSPKPRAADAPSASVARANSYIDARHAIVEKDLEVILPNSTGFLTTAPATCSTDCLPEPQMAATGRVVFSPLTAIEYGLDIISILVAAVVLTVFSPTAQLQQLYNGSELLKLSSSQHITRMVWAHRPMPWPSFRGVHADGEEARPQPWLSVRVITGCECSGDAIMELSRRCTFDGSPKKIGDAMEFQVPGYEGNLFTSTGGLTIHAMRIATELRCLNGLLLFPEYVQSVQTLYTTLVWSSCPILGSPSRVIVSTLVLKLVSHNPTAITLLTVIMDNINCAFLSCEYLGVDITDCIDSWLFAGWSVAACQESSAHPSSDYSIARETISGVLSSLDWRLLDFPCKSAATVCLSSPQELDHYFCSSVMKISPTLNSRRRSDVSYDQFSPIWDASFWPGYIVAGAQMLVTAAGRIMILACFQNGQSNSYLLLLPWIFKQEELRLGFQFQQSSIMSDLCLGNHSIIARVRLCYFLKYDMLAGMWRSRFLCVRFPVQSEVNCSVQTNVMLTHVFPLTSDPAEESRCCFQISLNLHVTISLTDGGSPSHATDMLLSFCWKTHQSGFYLQGDTRADSSILISLDLHSTISLADDGSFGWGAHQAVFCKAGTKLPLHLSWTSSTVRTTSLFMLWFCLLENCKLWLQTQMQMLWSPGVHALVLPVGKFSRTCQFPHSAIGRGALLILMRGLPSRTIDEIAYPYWTILVKEFYAPWDPGGHRLRAFNDTGLRASRMLRRGDCYEPYGPRHHMAWAAVRRLSAQCLNGRKQLLNKDRGKWTGGRRTGTWNGGPWQGRTRLLLPLDRCISSLSH